MNGKQKKRSSIVLNIYSNYELISKRKKVYEISIRTKVLENSILIARGEGGGVMEA